MLDHIKVLFLVFWGNSILSSRMIVIIYVPAYSILGSIFFTHSQAVFFLNVWVVAIHTGVRWYLIMLFVRISLMNVFKFVHWLFIFHPLKICSHFLGPFLNWIVLVLEFVELLMHFRIWSFIRCKDCKHFLLLY